MAPQALRRARTTHLSAALSRRPRSSDGVLQRIRDALFVGRGPLCLSGPRRFRRVHRVRGGVVDRPPRNRAAEDRRGTRPRRARRPRVADACAESELPERGDPLAGHAREEPLLLHVRNELRKLPDGEGAVSYTHLTLPTNREK